MRHQDEEIIEQDPTNEKMEKKEEKPKTVTSKRLRALQDTTQTTVEDTLKDPITMETFPLYTVKSVTIVNEQASYLIVRAYNCPLELRLWKSNLGNNKFSIGNKLDVF